MSGLCLVVNVTLFPTKHPGFNLKPCACIGFCEKKKKQKTKWKKHLKASHHALKCWAYWGTQAQADPPIQWLDHQVVWFSSGSTHFQLKWWTKPDQGLVDRPIGQTVWSGPLFKTLIFLSSWIIRVIYTSGLYGYIG